MAPVLPWLAALIGLGIGCAIVGGNSPWLIAFAAVPWLIVLGAIWP